MITRRQLLHLGLVGPSLAGAFSLERYLELLERAPAAPLAGRRPARSMILVWLDGGMSHVDTLDAKPGAPEEIKGAWGSVATPVPGVLYGQGMEGLASALPNYALIRSLTSDAGEHDIARHLMLTGYPVSPSLEHPSFASVGASQIANPQFPPYLTISPQRESLRYFGAGFLPPEHGPFVIDGNPQRKEFAVRDLAPPPELGAARMERRRALLETLDSFRRTYEQHGEVRARGRAFERALALLASASSREAFDLGKESAAMRARYGDHGLGQSCLLARRLVQAGARFVTILDSSWDTHQNNFFELQTHRLPKLNQAIPVLIEDLKQRGLWEETLLVVMGDFGRTPKVNANQGRDHWPRAASAIVAGGPIRGGAVVGATDERGEQVVERPVTPQDLAATIYTALGIDPSAEMQTSDGRPVRLVNGGEPIREVLA